MIINTADLFFFHMSSPKEKSVDVALEVTKQLLTISAALITALATLIKFIPEPSHLSYFLLSMAALMFLGAIVSGIFVYGSTVDELRREDSFDIIRKRSVVLPAYAQWTFFIAGTVMTFLSMLVVFTKT